MTTKTDNNNKEKIKKAIEIIETYGGIYGEHHKQWVLDQIIRILADDYTRWVKGYCDGNDGPDTYYWDKGIAP